MEFVIDAVDKPVRRDARTQCKLYKPSPSCTTQCGGRYVAAIEMLFLFWTLFFLQRAEISGARAKIALHRWMLLGGDSRG